MRVLTEQENFILPGFLLSLLVGVLFLSVRRSPSYIILFLVIFFTYILQGQNVTTTEAAGKIFSKNADIFGTRFFCENKGQFPDKMEQTVLYALDNGLEKIYFTPTGLVYEITELKKLEERDLERLEKGKSITDKKTSWVHAQWINANAHPVVEAEGVQSHYLSYGEKEFNSKVYSKLIYREVHPNIDVEFEIPHDHETGIKYSVIVHPGGDYTNFRQQYSGDVDRIKMLEDASVMIKTSSGSLVEHQPFSFEKGGRNLGSAYLLDNAVLSFSIESYDQTKDLVIDPWVSLTSTLTTNSLAYDVDYDFLGNTFVYGGTSFYKVAMYNPAGALQWTFMGQVTSVGWTSAPIASQASNFGVNRFTGKTFIGQGYNFSGNRIVRIDASGNYDNFINPANSGFQEVWDMGFHCLTADVFVLGGGVTSNISAVTINTVNSSLVLTTFQPQSSQVAQDIVSHAIDDQANIFVLYAGAFNNNICRVNTSFNGNIWTQATGYTSFSEQGNKNQYLNSGGLSSNGFNALAVNANYLFYYNGQNIAAYNKTTGAQVANTSISTNVAKQQGGIAVDDCNNLYLGGNGVVHVYNFNGTSFSSLTPIPLNVTTTNQYVFDIKLDKQVKKLHVSGSGFVGVYSPGPTLACPTQSSMCLFSQGGISVQTTSVSCASLGTGTCTAIGGTGPFTYTWIPSGQTGSVATGLNPGNHQIVVQDIGQNVTYTTTAFLAPLAPFTGSVTNPLTLDCNGVFNGTAAVTNLSGGSGNQTYLWTNGTTTQTTAVAVNLSPGPYSVTVVDALTSCSINATFSVTQPPALTLAIGAASPSNCVNTGIQLTPLPSGGTAPYSFSWSTGSQTAIAIMSEATAGLYNYTLTLTDSKNCSITETVNLNFIAGPVISVTSASICPQQTANLLASGANTYTWNTGSNQSFINVSPAANTIYTVSGTGSLCASTTTAAVYLKPVPVAQFGSSSPVCAGSTLQLNGSGGQNYQWSGPQFFTSTQQNPQVNNISQAQGGYYAVTVTAANGCTASASGSVLVNNIPAVSAAGSTVCITSQPVISCNIPGGYILCSWQGPGGYNSAAISNTLAASYSSNGLYTVTVLDANGCSNRAVASVSVVSMPSATITTNSPQCEGQTLQLSFNGTGVLNNYWTLPGNNIVALPSPSFPGVNTSATGVYTLTVSRGPCVSTATSAVLINPLPNFTICPDVNICAGRPYSLTVNIPSGSQVNWSGPGGGTGQGAVISFVSAAQQHNGTYTATVMDQQLCVRQKTVQVNVHANPNLAVPSASACLKGSAALVAGGASTYTWSGPGVSQIYGGQLNVNPVLYKLATYTVSGTAANGCTAAAIATVTGFDLPVANLKVFPSASLCPGQDITLSGSGGKFYSWTAPAGIFFNGQAVTFTLDHPGFTGKYRLVVTDENGCKGFRDTSIQVLPVPQAQVYSSSNKLCAPYCTSVSLITEQGNLLSEWQINGRQIQGNFNQCFTAAGEFPLKGKITDPVTTCTAAAEYVFEVYPNPVADFTFTPSSPTEMTDEVVFTDLSTGPEISASQWILAGSDIENRHVSGKTVRASYPAAGSYPVVLLASNAFGCLDTAIHVIHVEEDLLVYIPDAFTPNGDGLNDVFMPVCRGIRKINLQVFDRWGEMVYQGANSGEGWDGTYKGKPCKGDSYVWRITLSAKNGEARELHGHVFLNR